MSFPNLARHDPVLATERHLARGGVLGSAVASATNRKYREPKTPTVPNLDEARRKAMLDMQRIQRGRSSALIAQGTSDAPRVSTVQLFGGGG